MKLHMIFIHSPNHHPRARSQPTGRLRTVTLWTGLILIAVLGWSVLPVGAVPAGFQEYLILGNETQIFEMFRAIQAAPNLPGRMASVITVVATTDDQVIYYDHWEDGYEPDIQNPVQASTEVYGTPDSATGTLAPGDRISLNSDGGTGIHDYVPVPRGQVLRYDGSDRLLSIGGPIDIVHSLWPAGDVRVGGAWEIYPIGAWATGYSYIVPVGEDLYSESIDYMGDFQHVYLQIQALEDNTTVHINNGSQAISVRLNFGETYSSMGLIEGNAAGVPPIPIYAGTTLLSNKPIQGGLVTGQTTNQTRLFSLVPDADWGTDYVAPIPRTNERLAQVYLYNPSAEDTAVTAYDRDHPSGRTFPLPGQTTRAYSDPLAVAQPLPAFSALRLHSTEPIWAVASADAGEQRYDWGFSLVPTRFAGREYYVSWAPNTGLPPDLIPNSSPVWVAPLHDNTLFAVDYPSTDDAPDSYFVLDALSLRRIADPAGDSTGMHILADKPFVAVWGEDPAVADRNLGLDIGYPILPLDGSWQKRVLDLDISPDVQILPPDGGLLNFSLRTESSDYPVRGLGITDTLPLSCAYRPGSAEITYPDGRTAQLEPTIRGQDLWWPLDADLLAHQTLTLTFQAHLTPSGTLGPTRYDDMESGDYAGGGGWASPWIEDESTCTGDCVGPTTLGTPHSGDYHIRIADTGDLSRAADLSAFQRPTLRFWRQTSSTAPAPLEVRVYDGTSWTTVQTLDASSSPGAYLAEQLDLGPYRSTAFVLAFAGTTDGENYLDDVQIFDAAVEYVNSAQASGTYHNHRFTARDSARILLSPLRIEQTVDRAFAAASDKLRYTLHYTNTSPTMTATHALIRQSLPPNTIFVSASPGHIYQPAAHTLVWGHEARQTIPPGATGTLTATVTVDQWVTNGQRLQSQAYMDSDQTPEVASNLIETTIHAPRIVLTKHGPDHAAPGDVITYTIAYTNTGRVSATGVVLRDLIPSLTDYQPQSIALDTGSGYVPLTDAEDGDAAHVQDNTVIVYPGRVRNRISPGEWGRIRFAVRIEPAAPVGENIANYATLLREYARPQNSALLLTTITDLGLVKDADRRLTAPGDTIAYTVALQSSGQSAPTEVYVQEPVPAHTSYLPGSANVPAGFTLSYSTDYGSTWTETLPPDADTVTHLRWYTPRLRTDDGTGAVDLSYRVQVQDPLTGPNITICNQASAWSTYTPRLGSNRVCIETIDLYLIKSYAGTRVVPGQSITYTMRSSNRGSATALGVILTETVPAYTLFDPLGSSAGWSCPGGIQAGTRCTLALGDLALGESTTTQFTVRVQDPVPPGADTIVNRAQLYSRQGFGITQTHVAELYARAELVVDKTDGVTIAPAGASLTYTIALRNTGNQGAAGVVLTDTLPQNTTYVPGSASGNARYDPATHQIIWQPAAHLPGGQGITRTYRIVVQDPLPLNVLYLTNTVQVGDDGANGDTPNDNRATDTNTVDRNPALRIAKHGPATAQVGDRIVYTLTVGTVSFTPTGVRAGQIGDGSPIKQVTVTDAIAHPVYYAGGDDGDRLLELTETWVYTTSYTVTSADRGLLINRATARGIDINGDVLTATCSYTTLVPGQRLLLPLVLRSP